MSIAMDRTKKLAYLQIDDDIRQALQAFQPRVEALIPPILDTFYRHILKEERLAAMFTSDAQMQHAREAQARHWMHMFSGKFDDAYFQSVERIGKAHCMLGLEPSWYIGGYSLVKQALMQAVVEDASRGNPVTLGRRVKQATYLLQAIDKVITLDMDLAIAVYLAEKERDFSRRLSDLSDQFGAVIATITSGLAQASEGLAGEATSLAGTADSTATQVARAMTGSQQADANIQAVAAAVEELSASIAEISTQVTDAAGVSEEAVSQADSMTRSVRGLHEAADKVGGIIRLIEEIAEQTNLLALNATIEAARAGDAGKGFAVVAGEVKSLAQQTANATGEIAGQIKAIQDATADVGGQIETITASIGRVGTASSAIATAIEEQTSVTREVSRSIAETTSGVSAMQQAMHMVAEAANRTQSSAGLLSKAATDVRSQASELDGQARGFIERIRTADRRGEQRFPADAACTLTIDGTAGGDGAAIRFDCRLLDVSASGASVRADGTKLASGARGRLIVAGVDRPLTCTVSGRTANRIGLALDEGAGRIVMRALGIGPGRNGKAA